MQTPHPARLDTVRVSKTTLLLVYLMLHMLVRVSHLVQGRIWRSELQRAHYITNSIFICIAYLPALLRLVTTYVSLQWLFTFGLECLCS